MGQPIEITRGELSASALRAQAGKTDDGAVVRRLLALALVLEGQCRTEAALLSGMTRQTLRDWVHRYNAEGIDGLRSRAGPGRPPRLSDARRAELREIVLKGPDPGQDTVIRWRCADLCEEVAKRWSVKVCKQTMGRWLRRLKMTRLQPRPYHPRKDPEAEVTFKQQFGGLVKAALLGTTAGTPVEIWFQMPCRRTPLRLRAQTGRRPHPDRGASHHAVREHHPHCHRTQRLIVACRGPAAGRREVATVSYRRRRHSSIAGADR